MGPATYDLASLLRDSYVDLDEEFVAERAEEFRQRAVPGESRDTFRRRFELMSIQRNLKALGTFGYMATVRGSRVYLPYIPRTLANVRRNLARYPELSGPAPRAGAPPRGAAVTETRARIARLPATTWARRCSVQGWLHNKRSSGKLQFLIVRDGSGFAQAVVAKAAVPPEAWAGARRAWARSRRWSSRAR